MLNRDIYVLFTPLLVMLGANAHAETPVFLDQQFSSRPVEEPADVRFVQTKCPPIAREIVVCAQVKQEDSPYRLPLRDQGWDPDGPVESVARERSRLTEGGEAGIGSCSTVGAGGFTGCFQNAMKRRQQQRAGK
jgi:hypothetical protein